MRRCKFLAPVILIMALLALTACAGQTTQPQAQPQSQAQPQAQSPAQAPVSSLPSLQPAAAAEQPGAPASIFPVTVVDSAGRSVTLDAAPQRVITLAPSVTELLGGLALHERIVGTDNFSDWPESVLDLPKLGGIVDPDYEAMVALDPDLVLVAGGSDGHVAKLTELGIPAVVLTGDTFEHIFANLSVLGQLFDHQAETEAALAAMQARIDAVTAKVASLPAAQRPRVFYEVWDEPLMTVGPTAHIHMLIEMAGGQNIFADADTGWPSVSVEAVFERDPEVFITPYADTAAKVRAGERPGWDGISAVRNGRVHLVDDDLVSRPGPRLVGGLEEMAAAIHPELFGDR